MKKKKKTTSTRKTLPELFLLVACDAVSRDPNSRKLSLYGIFDIFWAEKFPSRMGQFSVLARLKGGTGKHTLKFEILDPDGKKVKGESALFDVEFSKDARAEIIVEITGVELQKTGIYKLVLRSGGRILGKPYEIRALRTKKTKKKTRKTRGK